jgi:D-arabinose 1-dehydrogenase-like Zn-dependent alcohol dehydrogenase
VVSALSYGTTGLSVGQRVFGLTDWTRDGTLAEYVVVEARNLAPLPGDVDFTAGASLVMPGLTAWQGLFEHGRLQAGQIVLSEAEHGIHRIERVMTDNALVYRRSQAWRDALAELGATARFTRRYR